MDWLVENKAWEWIFSGIGVVVMCWVAEKVLKKSNEKSEQRGIGSEVNVTNKGDVNVKTQPNITNSQVGAVGDHIHVSGGIHLNADNTVESVRLGESGQGSQTANKLNPPEKSRVFKSKKAPKVFISYARENQIQAERLYGDLKKAGAEPWLDSKNLLPGEKWKAAIGHALRDSDYVIVLLSTHSVSKRGYVQAEMKRALDILDEFPSDDIFVIPVRLDDCRVTEEKLLALNIEDLFHDWRSGLARIFKSVFRNIEPGPAQPSNISEPQPFKKFTDLVLPGGAMDVASHFYIERREDGEVLDGISRHRGLVTLQGPRQSGKTSMILRLYADAREKEMPFRWVMVDLQSLERHHFETLAGIWQVILTEMDTQLNLGRFNDALWNPNANVDRNVTTFLDRAVFSGNDTPLLICLDEVDRVFSMPIRSDFFSVLRAFYNRGAIDPAWKNVRWLLSTSSEPRFFIDDLTQSPFNVGVRVALDAFTFEETQAFVRQYGFIDQLGLIEKIMNYVGGRPYLVHLLLHHLTLEPARENDLFDAGTAGSGIFQSHINPYLSKLQEKPDLALAMKSVLAGNGCKNVKLASRLSAAGLVKEDADGRLVCACELYATYLKGKF
ncbi:AAA-like domain-containing protein [Desulfobacter sp. UBA2225]|uniref:AAA-like domain-containing protein n=1 Tax=Desulfobacter sp. UBA2225 TaxID=1961413 RepID=UPI002581076D|nr:AAA-like domain-containing protein [Desulfobacter sp. UBA2225]